MYRKYKQQQSRRIAIKKLEETTRLKEVKQFKQTPVKVQRVYPYPYVTTINNQPKKIILKENNKLMLERRKMATRIKVSKRRRNSGHTGIKSCASCGS